MSGGVGTITEPGREPGFLYQQNTLRDALVAALTFNIFHRHADRIHMANIAQMVNVLQAMILTDGPKMMLTPTYHVFSMFRPFHDAIHLPTDIQSPDYQFGDITIPALSVSAGRTTGGAVVVAMVNTNPTKSYPLEVTLTGCHPEHCQRPNLKCGCDGCAQHLREAAHDRTEDFLEGSFKGAAAVV